MRGSGTLTGIEDLAGVTIDFARMAGSRPGQLGFGGNDKDGGFGFSSWISWTAFQKTATSGDIGLGVEIGRGHGDINSSCGPTCRSLLCR